MLIFGKVAGRPKLLWSVYLGQAPSPSLPNRLCGPGQDSYNGEGGSACGQRYQGCISLRHPALAIARDRNGLGESAAGEADRIDEWDGRAL
ncbi:hypothetical protein KAM385_46610 [Aeromonas hydrophila]|nr:hypothetical protein KAM385_46610 [Aeromonas hydrophila]